MKLKEYTVLLLCPDFLAEDFGTDKYVTAVAARGPTDALRRARKEICSAFEAEEGYTVDDPESFGAIAVFAGAHKDLNPER